MERKQKYKTILEMLNDEQSIMNMETETQRNKRKVKEQYEKRIKEMRHSFYKQLKESDDKYEELERRYCMLRDSITPC